MQLSGPINIMGDNMTQGLLTRRQILGIAATICGGALLPWGTALAEPGAEPPVLMEGEPEETLIYRIKLWWMDNVAQVRLQFGPRSDSGTYEAIMEGESRTGFLPWLAGHPKYLYRSVMEDSGQSGRFRVKEFLRKLVRRGENRQVVEVIDYDRRLRVRQDWKGGQVRKVRRYPVPDGRPLDDFLTAFYNLRRGAYGEVRPGSSFVLDSIPDKEKPIKVTIKVATEAEEEKMGMDPAEGYLVSISSDSKDLESAVGGGIQVLFTREMVPKLIKLSSVLGGGDAWAFLESRAGSLNLLPGKRI